jgi:tRNA G10  N-methylase Trm11
MYVAILGRQPALSLAELERVFGSVSQLSHEAALVDTKSLDVERLGGTQKAGRVILTLPVGDWRKASLKIVQHYQKSWRGHEGKITLGISAYGFDASPRDVQKTGLILKSKLSSGGTSLRLVPNQEAALNTATSHHNKLGLSDNKIELLVVRGRSQVVIAESIGAQNITALAARDQGRPKRDAFIGMLPPKLAQIMINLALGDRTTAKEPVNILDPFCGTGVILQEALLFGYGVSGSDLNPKMVDYTLKNLAWFQEKLPAPGTVLSVMEADATDATWPQLKSIGAVVAETYLGQPFSAPPSKAKLTEVRGNCDHIIKGFLKNLAPQLRSGTPVTLAVPAWRASDGTLTHLPLISRLSELGYTRVTFTSVEDKDLVYFRPDQVVARELLVLTKA